MILLFGVVVRNLSSHTVVVVVLIPWSWSPLIFRPNAGIGLHCQSLCFFHLLVLLAGTFPY